MALFRILGAFALIATLFNADGAVVSPKPSVGTLDKTILKNDSKLNLNETKNSNSSDLSKMPRFSGYSSMGTKYAAKMFEYNYGKDEYGRDFRLAVFVKRNDPNYYVLPIPILVKNSVKIENGNLKFTVNFFDKEIQEFAWHNIRRLTGKCISLDQVNVTDARLTRLELSIKKFYFNIQKNIYQHSVLDKYEFQFGCHPMTFCNLLKSELEKPFIDLKLRLYVLTYSGRSYYWYYNLKRKDVPMPKNSTCESLTCQYGIEKKQKRLDIIQKVNKRLQARIVDSNLCANSSSAPCYPFAIKTYLDGATALNKKGRLMVSSDDFHDKTPGTVCSSGFDDFDATVVCRALYGSKHIGTYFRAQGGKGQIWLINVRCTGVENNLAECDHNGWGIKHYCNHNLDVGVECFELKDV